MPYNASTIIPEDMAPIIYLKCGNLRSIFYTIALVFWGVILTLLSLMATHSSIPIVEEWAHAIEKFADRYASFPAVAVPVIAGFMYCIYSRKTLSWYNALLIDEKPVAVLHYQFKVISGIDLIYLQSAHRLWILYPVTSQDNIKFKNAEIIKKETAENQIKIELLKNKLMASNAIEKRFGLFTKGFMLSFLIFVLTFAFILLSI